MKVTATLTERRADGMMKFERSDRPSSDHMRYVWLSPYEAKSSIPVGSVVTLEWVNGTGGVVGGHWAGWKVAA